MEKRLKRFSLFSSFILGAVLALGVGAGIGNSKGATEVRGATSTGTATIKFGKDYWSNPSSGGTKTDSLGQTWTITVTAGYSSNGTDNTLGQYTQYGSSKAGCSALSLSSTGLTGDFKLTAFSILYAGSGSGASSLATLKYGNSTIASGTGVSDSGNENLEWEGEQLISSGTTLSIVFSNISKGIKVFNFSYTLVENVALKYSVDYNGNGNTSGTVPEDNNEYESNDDVEVLGNTGNLGKTNYSFAGWSINSAAASVDYEPGDTFKITSNTTLYAVWTEVDHITAKAESFNVAEGKSLDLRDCVEAGGPGSLSFTFDANEYVSLAQDGYTLNGIKKDGSAVITGHQGSAIATFTVNCVEAPKVYTITPKHNAASDDSSAFTSFSSDDYTFDTSALTSSSGSKIYNGKSNTIKIGASSSTGSIIISLKKATDYITSIVINAFQYGSDSNKISIVPEDDDAIVASPNENLESTAKDYTFDVAGTDCTSFTLTTTAAKRAYINSISIYYLTIEPVAMSLTAANNKTTITSLEDDLQLTATAYSDSQKQNPMQGITFNYASESESVATVSDKGLVSPVSTGTTVITASYSENVYATITIKVLLVEINLVDSSSNLELNSSGSFTYSFSSQELAPTSIASVVWSSGTSSVIDVTANGSYEAKATGSSTISVIVTDSDGYVYNDSRDFTVVNSIVAPTHIDVEESEGVVSYIGSSTSLHITVLGENDELATNQNVTCVSSNANVLTVNNDGTITPKNRGTANITIQDEGKICESIVVAVRVRIPVLSERPLLGTFDFTNYVSTSDLTTYYTKNGDYEIPTAATSSSSEASSSLLKIGTSSSAGSVSVTFANKIVGKVVINGKSWSGDSDAAVMSGATKTGSFNDGSFSDVAYTFEDSVSSFTLSTTQSKRRLYIQSITIYGIENDVSLEADSQAVYNFEETCMHMEEYIGDESYNKQRCDANYSAAKTAFNALSLEQRNLFLENEAFADSAERLLNWATAHEESLDGNNKLPELSFNNRIYAGNKTNSSTLILIVSLSSVAAVGATMLLRKRKED